MLDDGVSPDIIPLSKRLELAKQQLKERKNAGSRSSVAPGGEAQSGGSASDGAIRGNKAGTSSASRGNRNHPGSSGNDEDARGLDRKADSGYSPNGGRVSRNSGRGAQAGGQDARKASLLSYQEKAIHSLKRALTYAGFDLQGDARGLTDKEQEELRPQVAMFFQRVGIALDWGVTHSNKAKAESEIWVFEDEEADKLADIYLKRARKIGWMAEVARQVQHLEDVGDASDVAAILGKRIIATGMFYPSNGGFGVWL